MNDSIEDKNMEVHKPDRGEYTSVSIDSDCQESINNSSSGIASEQPTSSTRTLTSEASEISNQSKAKPLAEIIPQKRNEVIEQDKSTLCEEIGLYFMELMGGIFGP